MPPPTRPGPPRDQGDDVGENRPPALPKVIILMGVSASGKTALGRRLAQALGSRFADADDYHSEENKKKMAAGEGLNDHDRAPWLRELRALIDATLANRDSLVLACSALKEGYRRTLGVDGTQVAGFLLNVEANELERRLRNRRGHFAGPSLLASQLATLEPPASPSFVIDANGSKEDVYRALAKRLSDLYSGK